MHVMSKYLRHPTIVIGTNSCRLTVYYCMIPGYVNSLVNEVVITFEQQAFRNNVQ